MKTLCQWSLTVTLVLAGIALLCSPVHAAAFQPTRFTVADQGAYFSSCVVSSRTS